MDGLRNLGKKREGKLKLKLPDRFEDDLPRLKDPQETDDKAVKICGSGGFPSSQFEVLKHL